MAAEFIGVGCWGYKTDLQPTPLTQSKDSRIHTANKLLLLQAQVPDTAEHKFHEKQSTNWLDRNQSRVSGALFYELVVFECLPERQSFLLLCYPSDMYTVHKK